MYTKRLSNSRGLCAAALVFVFGAVAGNAMADPPGRVARVSFLQGDVSFQPSGDDQWAQASLNRPLSTGDKVYTDRNSRVELEIGAANIRLDEHSTFNLLNLDDNAAQIELTDGVMNLHVRGLGNGQSVEVDTPTLAFVVNQAGNYRIDVAPEGGSTMVTVFDGAGDAYGENNASYSVRAGNSYRFNDSALRDYEVLDLPRQDDFDRWCDSRNRRYEHSVSSAYVAEDMIGYADLDDNGSWSDEPTYGHVWYPTTVAADWAPYRSGHWSWIDPWGWTWVDTAAWGFAPFHYGRWAYVGNRWGWCPGERRRWGSVYAPALVGFAGGNGWGVSIGGGGPVGWFPLGPRDVYVPWYRTSRDYFTNINVRNSRNITNINITNVYNNYSNGRPITNVNYAYRGDARAITAVSRETFIGSRAVGGARVQVNENLLRNTQVASRMNIAPTRASFVAAGAERGRAAPAATLDRRVVARTAPPPAALPIASRMQAIERNGAQPLATKELRQAATTRSGAPAQGRESAARIQVLGRGTAQPQPLPMRDAATKRADAVGERGVPSRGAPAMGDRAPVNSPNARAVTRDPANRGQADATDRSALPSARFAPHRGDQGNATSQERGNAATMRGNPVQSDKRLQTVTPADTRNQRNNEAGREGATRTFERQTPQTRTTTPAAQADNPSVQRETRQAPQQRYTQPQQQQPQVREAPQREMRQAQPQREVREAPQQRYTQPQQQQPQVREAPQREMRQAQPQREVREAPQQRFTPPPQQQQPQVREAPQREMRQAQPQPQPQAQPKAEPRARSDDRSGRKKDDDDNGRR